MKYGAETSLETFISDARGVLGDDTDVLAAGVFRLSDIAKGRTGGMILADLIDPSPGFFSTLVGRIAGKQHILKKNGVSEQLLAVVTPDRFVVLDTDDNQVVADFNRATLKVKVSKFMVESRLTLSEEGTDHTLKLTGVTGGRGATRAASLAVVKALT